MYLLEIGALLIQFALSMKRTISDTMNIYHDDATRLPINICRVCDKEVIGYVDTPEEEYICEECKAKEG